MLLSHPQRRERLVATCVLNTPMAQFRSEVQGWRVPDECVPKELLHALSLHPTSIIGACDDARRFCVIAAPREAGDFERVYKTSPSKEEQESDDTIMENANTNITKENGEEDVIFSSAVPPSSPPSSSPHSPLFGRWPAVRRRSRLPGSGRGLSPQCVVAGGGGSART